MALTKISTGMLKQDAASSDLNIDAGTLYIDVSNNRVGVANTSPTQALDVTGAIQTDTSFRAYDSVNTAYRNVLRYDGGNVRLETGTGSSLSGITMWTAGSERVRIDSSGNVGIGTTSPLSKFNVKGSQGNWRIDVDSVSSELQMLSTNTANTGFLNYRVRTNQFIVDTNGTERMRIDLSGNVGIGTTSLVNGDMLTVAGNLFITGKLFNGTSNNSVGIDFNSNYVNLHGYAGIKFYAEAAGIGSMSERMRIDSSGRVGIGVVPSTVWSSSYDALQVGLGGSVYAHASAGNALKIASNSVYEGTAPNYYDKYLSSSTATKYEQDAGSHIWFVAPSGTSGDTISWTEGLRINNDGKVGIGTSSIAASLDIDAVSASEPSIKLRGSNVLVGSGTPEFANVSGFGLQISTYKFGIATGSGTSPNFVIDNNGNVGIGTSSPVANTPLTLQAASGYNDILWLKSAGTNIASRINIAPTGTGNAQINNTTGTAIEFQTSGIERMRIDSTGNIGIGYTPNAWYPTFDVLQIGASGSAIFGRSENNVSGMSSNAYINTGGGWTYISTAAAALQESLNGEIAWYTAGSGTAGTSISFSERMRITNTGKIGFGTSSPGEMLQIDSADSAIRVNTTNATNNAELQLLYNNNLEHGMLFRYHGNSALGYIDNTYPRQSGYSYGDIIFRQNYAGTMTEHMRLTAYDGYLGLFTSTPKARLEANLHSGSESSLMNTSSVNDVQILRAGFGLSASTTSNAGAKWGLRFAGRNDGTYDNSKSAAVYAVSEDALGYNREVGLAFHTSAFDANHAERVRIDADGNVGIGTTSPSYKMEVDGGSAETRLRVSTTGTDADEAGIILANSSKTAFNDGIQIAHGAGITSFRGLTGSLYMAIDGSTNRIGIGTSSPTAKLHIIPGASSGTIPGVRVDKDWGSIDGAMVRFDGNVSGSGDGNVLLVKGGGTRSDVETFEVQNGSGTTLVVKGSGDVGIGTASPSTKLHVVGTTTTTGLVNNIVASWFLTGSYTQNTWYTLTDRASLISLGYGEGIYQFHCYASCFHAGISLYQTAHIYEEFFLQNVASNGASTHEFRRGPAFGHAVNSGHDAIGLRYRETYGGANGAPLIEWSPKAGGLSNLSTAAGYQLFFYLRRVG